MSYIYKMYNVVPGHTGTVIGDPSDMIQRAKTYKVVPGHTGTVVGDQTDMIRRTIESTKPKLIRKTTWSPHAKSKVTRLYMEDNGEPFNFLRWKHEYKNFT